MFDTINMHTYGITIDETILNSISHKSKRLVDTETGEPQEWHRFHDVEGISYIQYTRYGLKTRLYIDTSIPKTLYGNNLKLIDSNDIDKFFTKVHDVLKSLFNVKVDASDWHIVDRADVCWNYFVGDQISEYIQLLAKKRLPYKNTSLINHNETVQYWNGSSKIYFYDKQKECMKPRKKKRQPQAIIEQAKGILRLEIRLSKDEMKKFSPKKLAVDILSKKFFEHITQKVLQQVDFDSLSVSSNIDNIMDYETILYILKEMEFNIKQLETAIGFMHIKDVVSDTILKSFYKSSNTFKSRNDLISSLKLNNFSTNKFTSLNINYEQIS